MRTEEIPTLADHLQTYLSNLEPERLKAAEAAAHEVLRKIFRVGYCVGAAIQQAEKRAAEVPPSVGYAPWFIERRVNVGFARIVAYLIIRSGNRAASESKRVAEISEAIRFLARPRHDKDAVKRRGRLLLQAWQETSVVDTIFHAAGREEREFLGLLNAVVEGSESPCPQITAAAASIVPYLPARRGSKVSAESASHEFFLEMSRGIDPRTYYWSEYEGKCVDSKTEATRREFGRANFDPRSAYRRLKARQNTK